MLYAQPSCARQQYHILPSRLIALCSKTLTPRFSCRLTCVRIINVVRSSIMENEEPQYSKLFRVPTPLKAVFTILIFPFACTYIVCACGLKLVRVEWGDGKPVSGYCGTGHHVAVQRWERQKILKREEEHERPKPLPKWRKRSLTIPNVCASASFLKRRKATSDQSQSALFGRLPFEIREMIYKYYFAGSEYLYIYRRADNRLGHCRCDNKYGVMCPPGLSWGFDHTVTDAWNVAGNTNRDRDDLLSLLMTCRRAYVGDCFL